MRQLLHDWFTESNDKSFCPWNFCGMLAISVMCFKFAQLDKVDAAAFQSFGAAVGLIIAGIAGKRWSEHSES